MHETSIENMKYFIETYLGDMRNLTVLDVGSLDINGSYRPLFPNTTYHGLDIQSGDNVDIVAENPYCWDIRNNTYDCVVSGQTFEHIKYPEKTINEINRVLKTNGWLCIIAPSRGQRHEEPDYRRYTAYTMLDLIRPYNYRVMECYITPYGLWWDCVLIARKL